MGKRGRRSTNDDRNSKRRASDEDFPPNNMDDEIDSFHKQRDVIPLDVNDDIGESDKDDEQPVFDYKEINDDEDDKEVDDDDDDNDIYIAKMKKQLKFMQSKTGGVEEETDDDDDDGGDEEAKEKIIWGGKKYLYGDDELSDEDDLAEEAEILRMQREKVKNLSMEDFGLEDVNPDASDGKPTIEDILVKGRAPSKSLNDNDVEDDNLTVYEEVKKDASSLSREEQMDVVFTTAPELVGLLSDLNGAVEYLEIKACPLSRKIEQADGKKIGVLKYLELKQNLLLAYCQAIVFYLLLKSEGHPIHDHPVFGRLFELRSLLDKVKLLDKYLPPEIDEILKEKHGDETPTQLDKEVTVLASDSFTNHNRTFSALTKMSTSPAPQSGEIIDMNSLKDSEKKTGKRKSQNDQLGLQSMHMLKLRAALEEKIKGKGGFAKVSSKPHWVSTNVLQPMNGGMETLEDFDDEALDRTVGDHQLNNGSKPGKLSKLVSSKVTRANNPQVASGDWDLPKRDDIGERRRKHELRVLSRVGIGSDGDAVEELGNVLDNGNVSESKGSEDELYQQVKRERAVKLDAKAHKKTTPALPSSPETVAGKRHISSEIEKNRGLTRSRKKLGKNPRKKYKVKHQKAMVRRKGQVRELRKPSGPYGGEPTGINAAISRSIRFKS